MSGQLSLKVSQYRVKKWGRVLIGTIAENEIEQNLMFANLQPTRKAQAANPVSVFLVVQEGHRLWIRYFGKSDGGHLLAMGCVFYWVIFLLLVLISFEAHERIDIARDGQINSK